jgi:hypothetical protein
MNKGPDYEQFPNLKIAQPVVEGVAWALTQGKRQVVWRAQTCVELALSSVINFFAELRMMS